jgi:hypothetical protein
MPAEPTFWSTFSIPKGPASEKNGYGLMVVLGGHADGQEVSGSVRFWGGDCGGVDGWGIGLGAGYVRWRICDWSVHWPVWRLICCVESGKAEAARPIAEPGRRSKFLAFPGKSERKIGRGRGASAGTPLVSFLLVDCSEAAARFQRGGGFTGVGPPGGGFGGSLLLSRAASASRFLR